MSRLRADYGPRAPRSTCKTPSGLRRAIEASGMAVHREFAAREIFSAAQSQIADALNYTAFTFGNFADACRTGWLDDAEQPQDQDQEQDSAKTDIHRRFHCYLPSCKQRQRSKHRSHRCAGVTSKLPRPTAIFGGLAA
jgi:hypothetical protein